ncbi:cytochrome C biogenesis protein [Bacillus manliponensis]|uniref:Cytochrome C biogenesis protein n=1 Tax=Bacillus manliponensis TaxID=574376 RepID=A0A073JWK7_9BACI|nr:divalent cation tolerance protein CutA [Bacillus manliponensis]KEK18646.1 cytochrome C biogenesis protein [Bacillus manliponensis]
MQFNEVKIEIFIPEPFIEQLRDELHKVHACKLGDYDHCLSYSTVKGYWRPLQSASPYDGEIGQICEGQECKVEIRCNKKYVKHALTVIRRIHPYETPMIYVIPLLNDYFEDM